MNSRTIIFLITLLLIMLTVDNVYSQSGISEELDPVVVTATSVPVELSDSVSSVTVFDNYYITSQNSTNIVDILKQVPGLYADRSAGLAGTSSVYLRGGDPSFTMVMIDGVRVNDPTNSRGGSFDFTTLSLASIEKIEIIKAPLSALYGSDAISGVINVITKKGDGPYRNKVDLSVSTEGGYRIFGEAGALIDRFNYSFSASYHDDGKPVDESSYTNFSLNSNLGYRFSKIADLQIVNRFSSTDKERFPDDSGGSEFAVIRETENDGIDQVSSGLRLNLDHSDNFRQKLHLEFFFSSENISSPGIAPGMRNPGGVPARDEHNRFFRNEFMFVNSYSPAEEVTASIGFNTVFEDGDSEGTLFLENEVPANFGLDRFYYAFFGEVLYNPVRGLELVAGIRLDILNDIDNELSPRLGASYYIVPTATKIKVNYGEGFKLPSFYALGNPIVGNKDLKPETSRSADLEIVQYLFHEQIQTSLTFFYNEFQNLVDLQEQPELRLVNRSNVISKGLELGMSFNFSRTFNVSGNLSYIKTDIEDSDEELRNRPEWLANIIINWLPRDDVRLFINGNYTGEILDSSVPTGDVMLDGYFRVDGALSYRINERFKTYVRVENIFNNDYQQFVGFDAPGIRPTLGLRGYF